MRKVKIKTSELIGRPLDWAVAKARGLENSWLHDYKIGYVNRPSTDWAHGGPIIETEMQERGFDVWRTADMKGCAATYERGLPDSYSYGATPLIAAMRAVVALRLGSVYDTQKGIV